VADLLLNFNNDADPGGDGTTAALSSGDNTHAYDSWGALQTARAGTIATGDRILNNMAGVADNTNISIAGWTPADRGALQIIGDIASAKWDTNKATFSSGSYSSIINIATDNVIIKGVQILSTYASTLNSRVVKQNSYINFELIGCHVRGGGAGATKQDLLTLGTLAKDSSYIVNNIFHGDGVGRAGIRDTVYNATRVIYNNTVVDCAEGMLLSNKSNTHVKNNIATGNTTDYTGVYSANALNNLSGDATAVGTDSIINATVVFTDAANEDYSLAASDASGAKLGGADLDADAQYAVTDDIAGVARHATTPTIGAAEDVVAGGGVTLTNQYYTNLMAGM